jgi:hypothetical protein
MFWWASSNPLEEIQLLIAVNYYIVQDVREEVNEVDAQAFDGKLSVKKKRKRRQKKGTAQSAHV